MRWIACLLLALTLGSAGCAVYTRPIPPPARLEVRPAGPRCPGAVWVSGHWKWQGRRSGYNWISGHWRCP
ncbi:MAG: YXWGXW repeat-containing protein [Candidatus Eisenbacteria bacterium]|nr:YXWGXW repeat-containing protein [Candidatus Eisenbacteria bacterium]